MRRDYNLDVANMLVKCLSEAANVDFREVSKENKHVYSTSLLYKLFKDYNGMNDRMMSDYFKEVMGVSKNRSAIYTSLKKVDIYYSSHEDFRCLYDSFFNDKIDARVEKETKRKEYLSKEDDRKSELKNRVSFAEFSRKKLINTVKELPEDRFKEIKELVELRIKSWSWKSRDRCEIIEASEGIEGRAY